MKKTFEDCYKLVALLEDCSYSGRICDDETLAKELRANNYKTKVENLPAAVREYIDFNVWREGTYYVVRDSDCENWQYQLERYTNHYFEFSIIVLHSYLTSYMYFCELGEDPNPPVFFWIEGDASFSIAADSLAEYVYKGLETEYKKFQERLAGRMELRERVEQAKAILKPLYETANALIKPYVGEGQEKQNFRMLVIWLTSLYGEIFYNPYLLRYHSDYSKWESEALKYNDLVRKYLALILPTFEKENPPLALRVAELGRQFVNFEQTIRWVAAAPDATVKKPSPAAQDAAKEERDITDFLL